MCSGYESGTSDHDSSTRHRGSVRREEPLDIGQSVFSRNDIVLEAGPELKFAWFYDPAARVST